MKSRLERGLTLVETLVVLAIAGLIIAVLIAVLLPSDDRKCRLEAERLAAFLTAASAESVMRDAPVRVIFDFDRGIARREFAKVGASITEALWDEDEKSDPFKLSSPVRFDTVDSAESPERTSGDGYMIFRGERTEGAVVVLGIEQIFYSVVVPPNGAEIKVEKGRSGRPGAGGQPINRDLPAMVTSATAPLGDTLPGPGLGGVAGGNPNFNTGRDRRASKSKTKTPTKAKTPTPSVDPAAAPAAGTVNPGTAPAVPPAPKPAVENPGTGTVEPTTPPEQPNTANPGSLGTACVSDVQCGGEFSWASCEVALGTCVLNPVGRALRITGVEVTQPASGTVRTLLGESINAQINLGGLNLVTYFDSGRAWLVQAQRTGAEFDIGLDTNLKQYEQISTLPSYPGEELGSTPYTCDSATLSCEVDFALADDEVTLWVPRYANLSQIPPQTCGYQQLSLGASVDVRVTLEPNFLELDTGTTADGEPKTRVQLITTITRNAANDLSFQGRLLSEWLQEDTPLESAGDDEVADTNGDGLPDAWRFVFDGNAQPVALADTPGEDPLARPDFCD